MAEGTEYSSPLTFVNHQDVRTQLIVAEELYGITHHEDIADEFTNGRKGRAKKLKNKGGKTAVSIQLLYCVKNHLICYSK